MTPTPAGIISSVGTITIDEVGAIQSFDAVSERLFGYRPNEVLGRNVAMLMPDPYCSEHDQYLARYRFEGAPRIIGKGREVTGQRKDLSTFPLWLAVSEVNLAGQRLFVGSVVDLSEQKAVEADLARSLEVTRAILNTAVNPIITIDAKGLIRSFNPAAERLFEYLREEVIGRNVKMLMPEPYRTEHDGYLERFLHEGDPHIIGFGREVEGRKRDGSTFPLHLSVGAMESGQERMFVGIIADITERKAAEAELLRHRDHLKELVTIATSEVQAIVQNALSGIITNDESGTIHLFNPSCEKLFGWTRDEVVGRNVSLLLGEGDAALYNEYIRKRVGGVGTNGSGLDLEVRALRKDGSTFPARLGVGHMELADSKHFFVAFLTDITEQKQVETVLKQAKDDAESGMRTKAAFIANMSHEIRTPMNAILGFAEVVLQDPILSRESARHVQIILNSARSLLGLINDVLDVSKLESGRFALERVAFHLPNAVTDALRLVEHRAAEKNLHLLFQYDPELPIRVTGDPTRVRQVILNLLSNAIKFTDKGRISIEIRPGGEPDLLHFSVADTGIGMNEEQLDRVFRPFSQADASTTRRFGGTGLGTAISKQIVELMGGQIWVESTLNRGSTFHFTAVLPEANEQDNCVYENVTVTEKNYVSPRLFHVLLAEDIEENALLATLRLREQGHKVDWVKNGLEAVTAYERLNPDLILMDVMMPELDGLDATRRIRDLEKGTGQRITILALTASVMREDNDKCLAVDMDAVEGKPIDFNALFAHMEQLVPQGIGRRNEFRAMEFANQAQFDYAQLRAVARVEDALRTWRNESSYARALMSFAEHHAQDAEKILHELASHPGDLEPVRRMAHSLKGVAGNLFLTQVAQVATRIDAELKTRNMDVTTGLLPELHLRLAEATSAISHLAYKEEGAVTTASRFDPDVTLVLLKELKSALEGLDPDSAELLLTRLSNFLPTAELNRIKKEIDSFKFDEAQTSTVELATRLGLRMD